jgi:hypothetical protein
MTATLDRELLARIGTVLYGEHWQAPMARALGKSQHTVSRWSTGSTRLPSRAIWLTLSSSLNTKLMENHNVWIELSRALRSTESGRF